MLGTEYGEDTLKGALSNLKRKYNETYAKHMRLAEDEVMKAHEEEVEDHDLSERTGRDSTRTQALSLIANKLRSKGNPKRTESKNKELPANKRSSY